MHMVGAIVSLRLKEQRAAQGQGRFWSMRLTSANAARNPTPQDQQQQLRSQYVSNVERSCYGRELLLRKQVQSARL